MPGHRSARIRATDGGNGAQNTSGPPPADPRIPKQLAKDTYKDMTVDPLVILCNLARGEFIPEHEKPNQARESQDSNKTEAEEDPLFYDSDMDLDIPVLDANVWHIPASPAIIHQSQANAQELVPHDAVDTLQQQVDDRRTRDIIINVFLSKVIEGYVHDKWFGKPNNMAKITRVIEFLFKEHALAFPDFGGVRQAAMYQMHEAPWGGTCRKRKNQMGTSQRCMMEHLRI